MATVVGERTAAPERTAQRRSPPGLVTLMLTLGLLTTGWCVAAAGAPATYGARTTADEPQYLLSAISLAEDLDLDISDELADERWREFHAAPLPEQTEPLAGGRRVSPHDPLLPLVLAAPVAAGGWLGAKLTLAAMAGGLAALTLWTAVRRFGARPVPAAVTAASFALAAPLATYATQVYPELPAALLVVAAVAVVTGPFRSPRSVAGFTLLVAALPWLSVKYAPVAAALALVGCWRLGSLNTLRPSRSESVQRTAILGGGLTLAAVAFAWFHRAVYGGWTAYAAGDHFAGGEATVVGRDPDYASRAQRLYALLVDRGFGLAAWAPVVLVAVVALAAFLRRRPPGWVAVAPPLAAGWLTATFLALTMHGWWWPGRQTVVVVPLLVLVTAWWVDLAWDRIATHRTLAAGLAAVVLAGVLAWAWVVADAEAGRLVVIVDFEQTTNPLYRAWRLVLPDHRRPTTLTPVLDGVWVAVLAGLAALGWRSAGGRPDGSVARSSGIS